MNICKQKGAPLNTEGIPAGTVLRDLEARVFNQMGEEVGEPHIHVLYLFIFIYYMYTYVCVRGVGV